MARNLIKVWLALSTFARHKNVEPTNNHAERSLRGAVIYGKLSLGSQSEQGDYLSDLLAAHARGEPAPQLA